MRNLVGGVMTPPVVYERQVLGLRHTTVGVNDKQQFTGLLN